MNKLFKTIGAISLGLAMAAGVAVGASKIEQAEAAKVITPTAGNYYIGATSGGNDYYLSVPDSAGTGVSGTAKTSKSDATIFTFAGSGTSWTIKLPSGNFLSLASSKANGKVNVQSSSATWTSSTQGTGASAKLRLSINSYSLQKNNSGTQFGSYAQSQTDVWLESASTTPIPLTDVAISTTESVVVGSSKTISVTMTPENANTLTTFVWSSSDDKVATVSSKGVVTGVSEGTCTITLNATDISKSVTCALTVEPIPPVVVTHTIADCYTVATGTSVKFNGLYMGTYGTNPYQGIFFADGEYGILIYGIASVPAIWEVGKTVVAISGTTAFYNGLIQIKDASFELTSATVDNPVVYTFLGTETTGIALSRKTSVTGIVTAVSGSFESSSDTKVTVKLSETATTTIYIKKNVYTAEQLTAYSNGFVVDNKVVVTGFLNYFNSSTTFGGTYDPASFQLIVPTIISSGEDYTAIKFATDFNTATGTVCAQAGDDHLTGLQGIWTELNTKYSALDAANKAALVDSGTTDEAIIACIARYDYVCGKYNTSTTVNLTEFIEGHVVPHSSSIINLRSENSNSNTSVIVIIAITLASVTGLGVLLAIKRRKNLVK